jgi:hypothetical protein
MRIFLAAGERCRRQQTSHQYEREKLLLELRQIASKRCSMEKVNEPISAALCRPSRPSGSETAARNLPILQTIRQPPAAAKAVAIIERVFEHQHVCPALGDDLLSTGHTVRKWTRKSADYHSRSHTLLPIV